MIDYKLLQREANKIGCQVLINSHRYWLLSEGTVIIVADNTNTVLDKISKINEQLLLAQGAHYAA